MKTSSSISNKILEIKSLSFSLIRLIMYDLRPEKDKSRLFSFLFNKGLGKIKKFSSPTNAAFSTQVHRNFKFRALAILSKASPTASSSVPPKLVQLCKPSMK